MADLFIFKSSLRDLLRAKRMVASILLILAPAGIALLWRFFAADAFDPFDAYNTLSSVVVYGFLLVILSVVFGTGVISQEIEQKTIVYLLTRPVPRWRIVIMKFLAAVTGISVTVLAATLLLGIVTVWSGGEQSSVVRMRDVRDRELLVTTIAEHTWPAAEYLYDKLPQSTREALDNRGKPQPAPPLPPSPPGRRRGPIRRMFGPPRNRPGDYPRMVLDGINRTLLTDTGFYSDERFPDVLSNQQIKDLLAAHPTSGPKLAKLNRLLFESIDPKMIAPRPDPVFPIGRDMYVLPVGALAYGALFLLLATLLNRPLMYGLVFAFGWETWVPNMPGKFGMVSIMTYLRALAPHPQPSAESQDLLQFLSGGNVTVITHGLAKTVLVCVIAIGLMGALAIFSNNEYVPREDAE